MSFLARYDKGIWKWLPVIEGTAFIGIVHFAVFIKRGADPRLMQRNIATANIGTARGEAVVGSATVLFTLTTVASETARRWLTGLAGWSQPGREA